MRIHIIIIIIIKSTSGFTQKAEPVRVHHITSPEMARGGEESDLEQLMLTDVKKTRQGEFIGKGSYGAVFEVEVHGTLCAAKEMYPILISEKYKRDFLKECVRCSRILHPNVVQFIGVYKPTPQDVLPWLVMELMHTSLSGLIQKYEDENKTRTKKKDIPFHFKVSILQDTCKGLQFLHSKNIIHRDLSSNNILLTKHCVAKIADLGVAKVLQQGTQSFTRGAGTPVFLPPEACLEKPKYRTSYDVFSLGCVCIHLISMQFPDPSSEKIMDDKTGKVVHLDLTELQRRNKYLAKFSQIPDLKNLIEQCLQDAAKYRPNVGEVIECLKNANYNHLPHENDSIIELFDSLIQREKELQDLHLEKVNNYEEDSDDFSFINFADHLTHNETESSAQPTHNVIDLSTQNFITVEQRFDQVYIL